MRGAWRSSTNWSDEADEAADGVPRRHRILQLGGWIFLKEEAPPAPPEQGAKRRWRIVIGIIIFLLLVLGMIKLIQVGFFHGAANYFNHSRWRLVEVLFGGVVGSLVATLIYGQLNEDVWASDIRQLRNDVASLLNSVAHLSSDVSTVRLEYGSLLGQLPTALGGDFTSSVLAYFPRTSRSIAAILGDEARASYGRHFERVAVTKARDKYKVVGLEEVVLGGVAYPVWKLRFMVEWDWFNDSQLSLTPFDRFTLVISAPDQAMESLVYDKDQPERESLWLKFQDFSAKQNIVRSIVGHPADSTELLSPSEADVLFNVDEIRFSLGGAAKRIPADDFVALTGDDLPPLAYRAMMLPQEARRTVLEVNKSMWVQYQGFIMVPAIPVTEATWPSLTGLGLSPAAGVGNSYSGIMHFPPSDVVAEAYTLQMVYPKADPSRGGLSVRVDETRSGCLRRYVWDPASTMTEVGRHEVLSGGLSPTENEGVAQMRVEGPLTDLCRMNVVWYGAQLVAPDAERATRPPS